MQEDPTTESQVPQPSPEATGSVPYGSEGFGTFPNGSESFRNIPNDSESVGTLRKTAERTEAHTLTVREVARRFEDAGVARTERSIVNWCQINAQGVARLDSYYDPNERKYYITPQSVERAIEEEKARSEKQVDRSSSSESTGKEIPKASERGEGKQPATSEEVAGRVEELELKLRDLEITNRVKDQVIAEKDKQMERMHQEQREYVERLINSSRHVGELETRLLQLEAPEVDRSRRVEVRSVRTEEDDHRAVASGNSPA